MAAAYDNDKREEALAKVEHQKCRMNHEQKGPVCGEDQSAQMERHDEQAEKG
jgi:hypothetical protein